MSDRDVTGWDEDNKEYRLPTEREGKCPRCDTIFTSFYQAHHSEVDCTKSLAARARLLWELLKDPVVAERVIKGILKDL
jgi:hypothetical protein